MMYSLNLCFLLCYLRSCYISIIDAALIYPTNSEFGIFMAISVPISLPHRNVFLSYNYEFNFYQPEHIYKFPPILMGPDFEDGYLTYPTTGREQTRQCHNCTVSANSTLSNSETLVVPEKVSINSPPERQKRELSLINRKSFYLILRDKMDRSGYPSEACLLRLICETNASALGEINGLLGNIVHIIFSPSSSRDERLPPDYYQAESDGLQGQCSSYNSDCPHNVMDLISVPVEHILSEIVNRRRRK